MNFYTGKDLADSFRTVRKNTLVIANDIPEDQYSFKVGEGTRTVGELLVHIALAFSFQYQLQAVERRSSLVGFDFPSLMGQMAAEEKRPRNKAQVIDLLASNGEKWANWLEGLNDDFLGERVQMPPGGTPPSRTRFDMVMSVKEHEMHHRGQLMLIERIIGIVPHLTRAMQARMAGGSAPARN
jgi:uncharacterized damage-inducible protein DinB